MCVFQVGMNEIAHYFNPLDSAFEGGLPYSCLMPLPSGYKDSCLAIESFGHLWQDAWHVLRAFYFQLMSIKFHSHLYILCPYSTHRSSVTKA